jgi:hypothetical protein
MSALPSQEPPKNQNLDPVSRFKASYATALEGLSVAVLHTSTQGWQELYTAHRKAVRDRRQELAALLRDFADGMERRGLCEQDEKDLGDIRKASAELRAAEDHWQLQTVGPVKAPVDVCQQMLADAVSEAVRLEAREPMLNVGLEELMRMEVAKCIRASWDEDTGKATHIMPGAVS